MIVEYGAMNQKAQARVRKAERMRALADNAAVCKAADVQQQKNTIKQSIKLYLWRADWHRDTNKIKIYNIIYINTKL